MDDVMFSAGIGDANRAHAQVTRKWTTLGAKSDDCTGCGFRSEYSSSCLFWRTARFYTHVTSVRWPVSTTCLVDEHPVRFYQGQPPRGTARQTVNSRQPSLCGCGSTHLEYTANWRRGGKFTRCPPSVDCQNVSRSSNHIQTLSTGTIQLVVLAVVATLMPL